MEGEGKEEETKSVASRPALRQTLQAAFESYRRGKKRHPKVPFGLTVSVLSPDLPTPAEQAVTLGFLEEEEEEEKEKEDDSILASVRLDDIDPTLPLSWVLSEVESQPTIVHRLYLGDPFILSPSPLPPFGRATCFRSCDL